MCLKTSHVPLGNAPVCWELQAVRLSHVYSGALSLGFFFFFCPHMQAWADRRLLAIAGLISGHQRESAGFSLFCSVKTLQWQSKSWISASPLAGKHFVPHVVCGLYQSHCGQQRTGAPCEDCRGKTRYEQESDSLPYSSWARVKSQSVWCAPEETLSEALKDEECPAVWGDCEMQDRCGHSTNYSEQWSV